MRVDEARLRLDGVRRRPLAVVLVVAVVAVVTGLFARPVWDDRARVDRAREAEAAARRAVVSMISVSSKTLEQDIADVLALSTGEFRTQFEAQRSSYVEAIGTAGVTAQGDVVEVGVVSNEVDEVILLVASTATVRNAAVPEGDRRAYRMKVTLVPSKDRWLVSKMELVA
jgi:Mce-associated membrane protein